MNDVTIISCKHPRITATLCLVDCARWVGGCACGGRSAPSVCSSVNVDAFFEYLVLCSVNKLIDSYYDDFLKLVATARKLSIQQVCFVDSEVR